jgi:hypothetical protein
MEIMTSSGVEVFGTRPGDTFVEKFGRNQRVASGTPEDIWDGGGIYDFPDVASILDIQSDSVEDNPSGTGATDIGIQGLDENYELQTEIVELNGTTTVNTTKKFLRVFRSAVRNAGSSGTNVGNITLDSQEEALTMAQITALTGQTNMALYTIPRGYVGFLKKWYVALLRSSGTAAVAIDVDIFRRNTDLANAWKSTQPIGIQNNGHGAWQYEFPAPIKLPAKSDLVVNGIPTGLADVSAGFTLFLMKQ